MPIALRPGTVTLLALGALALAGCKDDSIVARNASVEEVAKQVAKSDVRPAPGRWESKMQIKAIEMPGMPAQMQAAMQQQMGQARTVTSCLTKAQADASDGEMFKQGARSGCRYDHFAMGSGRIDAVLSCANGPMTQKMTMRGTYSDNAYAMEMTSEGNANGKPIRMVMAVASRRVGDCDGTEDSANPSGVRRP